MEHHIHQSTRGVLHNGSSTLSSTLELPRLIRLSNVIPRDAALFDNAENIMSILVGLALTPPLTSDQTLIAFGDNNLSLRQWLRNNSRSSGPGGDGQGHGSSSRGSRQDTAGHGEGQNESRGQGGGGSTAAHRIKSHEYASHGTRSSQQQQRVQEQDHQHPPATRSSAIRQANSTDKGNATGSPRGFPSRFTDMSDIVRATWISLSQTDPGLGSSPTQTPTPTRDIERAPHRRPQRYQLPPVPRLLQLQGPLSKGYVWDVFFGTLTVGRLQSPSPSPLSSPTPGLSSTLVQMRPPCASGSSLASVFGDVTGPDDGAGTLTTHTRLASSGSHRPTSPTYSVSSFRWSSSRASSCANDRLPGQHADLPTPPASDSADSPKRLCIHSEPQQKAIVIDVVAKVCLPGVSTGIHSAWKSYLPSRQDLDLALLPLSLLDQASMGIRNERRAYEILQDVQGSVVPRCCGWYALLPDDRATVPKRPERRDEVITMDGPSREPLRWGVWKDWNRHQLALGAVFSRARGPIVEEEGDLGRLAPSLKWVLILGHAAKHGTARLTLTLQVSDRPRLLFTTRPGDCPRRLCNQAYRVGS